MKSFSRDSLTKAVIFLAFWAGAFFSYQQDVFLAPRADNAPGFDRYSESLVVGNVVADELGLEKGGWSLGFIEAEGKPVDPELAYNVLQRRSLGESTRFAAYPSQVGVQGWFFSLAHRVSGLSDVEALNSLNALLMSGVIALLSVLYFKIYGAAFGTIFFATMVGSPWIFLFARNLYWVPFTWFLPAVFAALAYLSTGRATRAIFLCLLALAICLKSLAGYEFLTTITLFTCSVFVLGPMFRNDQSGYRNSVKYASLVFSLCVLGFLVALLWHANIRGDSVLAGLQDIYNQDVKRRTYGDPTLFNAVYRASLESSFTDVFRTYWNEWKTPLVFTVPGSYLNGIFWWACVGLGYLSLSRRKLVTAEMVMVIVFCTVTTSWFMFGKAHSYIHTQLNYVLWYFGFVQALLFVLFRFATTLLADMVALGRRLGWRISAVAAVCLSLLVFYIEATWSDHRIRAVLKGVVAPVEVGAGFQVIFRGDDRMVFFARKCPVRHLDGYFILHFTPMKKDLPAAMPHGFQNRDFAWPFWDSIPRFNPLSRYRGSCYSELPMPKYKLQALRTGQYLLSEAGEADVRWDRSFSMPELPGVNEFSPQKLTNANWENGISRERAGFFVDNSFLNRASFDVGDVVVFPFSGKRVITGIDYSHDFINIHTEGAMLDPAKDGYPHTLRLENSFSKALP